MSKHGCQRMETSNSLGKEVSNEIVTKFDGVCLYNKKVNNVRNQLLLKEVSGRLPELGKTTLIRLIMRLVVRQRLA